jgi:hypothetical protein
MPTIDTITVADPPESWVAAGFTVDDDRSCRVGTVRIDLVGREAGKRILSWSLREADVTDGSIDGLSTEASDAGPTEPAVHPNGCVLIDHVVIFSPDLDRTTGALQTAGLEMKRSRATDTYGAPMEQRFFRLGEVILELIGTPDAHGDGPAGFFGLAHTVADLDATKLLLGDRLGNPKEAVQPGRRIATLRHKELGMTVATAFMSPET